MVKKQTGNKYLDQVNIYKNGLVNHIKSRFMKDGITLEEAFDIGGTGKKNIYSEEMKKYIREFGSTMNERSLKLEIKDVLYRF
jgi:hypothetical protein